SGADSWTSSTPAPASSGESTSASEPSRGKGVSVSRLYARRAFSSTSATIRSVCGAGSYRRTSTPFRRKRAAQPAPITPPPTSPTARGRSDTRAEGELLAHLVGPEHAYVHPLEDRDRALDQLGVRREVSALEPEVVLETDADVAAREHRQRDERQLHAPD